MFTGDVLKAIETFATKAHEGQQRKYTPEPYIAHPVRVMELCRKYTERRPVLAAALLHDVLEDTAVTQDELQAFLRSVLPEKESSETLRMVIELTDLYVKEKFPEHNRRTRKQMERERIKISSADSQTVKYADIIDNCNEIVKHDRDFARVFLHECRRLLEVMKAGDRQLYRLAVETVEAGLRKLRALSQRFCRRPSQYNARRPSSWPGLQPHLF